MTENLDSCLPRGGGRFRILGRVWALATSPTTFVVLTLLWCLDLGVGSILAWREDPEFWVKMDAYPMGVWLREVAPAAFPLSLWVYALVALTYLVVLSLVLCTLHWFFRRRRRARGMGEVLIHLGFLLVFAGFVLEAAFGTRAQGLPILEGTTVPVPGLGLGLRLDRIETVHGADGQPLDTVSQVSLLEGTSEIASGTVRANHPLIRGATVVYPAGAQVRVLGARVHTGASDPVPVRFGNDVPLPGGRFLAVRGALNSGERYGPWIGPGVLLALLGPSGSPLGSGYLSPAPGMPRSLRLGGDHVRLVELIERTYGVYHVHRDPGVQLVLAGAAALALGTVWAFVGYITTRPPRPVETEHGNGAPIG